MGIRQKTIQHQSYYFITFTFLNWSHVCISEKYFQLFYKWFDYQRLCYQNKIHAYVLMPNHFHGIFYLSSSSPPLPKLIQNGKRFLAYKVIQYLHEDNRMDILHDFAQSSLKTKGAHHRVFEPRYDAKLLDDYYIIAQKIAYIHGNPCKGHWLLASCPEEYLYSSAQNYAFGVGKYEVDVLDFL